MLREVLPDASRRGYCWPRFWEDRGGLRVILSGTLIFDFLVPAA